MTEDPQAKLRELVDELRYYRSELKLAQERGDEDVAPSMRRMIRTHKILIHDHCAEYGLPLLAGVEEEEAGLIRARRSGSPQIVAQLEGYRRLATAKSNGNGTAIVSTERAIRVQHELIRRHCALHGLTRPADVP